MGRAATVLDGENVRFGTSKDLGFDLDSRSENVRRTIEIAKLFNRTGLIAICSLVAPTRQLRLHAREDVGEDFLLVYLSAPLEVCKERDNEGFYAAAEKGDMDTVPGVNLQFEAPDDADLVLPTHEISVGESVDLIVKLLEAQGTFDLGS